MGDGRSVPDGLREGCSEAHTGGFPPSGAAGPGRSAGDGASPAPGEQVLGVAAAAADLARQLHAELQAARGVQPGLFGEDAPDDDGLPEVLPIGGARNRLDGARGRGRPKGSANKRTELMRDYLLRRGYTHPMEALAAIASASVDEVAAEIVGGVEALGRLDRATRIDVRSRALDQIRRAASDLMPYFESRRPTEVKVTEDRLHLFIAGRLDAGQAEGAALSLTGDPSAAPIGGKIVDYQGLGADGAVRDPATPSHDDA